MTLSEKYVCRLFKDRYGILLRKIDERDGIEGQSPDFEYIKNRRSAVGMAKTNCLRGTSSNTSWVRFLAKRSVRFWLHWGQRKIPLRLNWLGVPDGSNRAHISDSCTEFSRFLADNRHRYRTPHRHSESDPAETCRTFLRTVLRIDRRMLRSVAGISRGAGFSLERCSETSAIDQSMQPRTAGRWYTPFLKRNPLRTPFLAGFPKIGLDHFSYQ